MKPPRTLIPLIASSLLVGCTTTYPVIKFTDIQSRREYRSIGSPNILQNGAVNFQDETTGKAVVLQSWEAEDDAGRSYTFQTGKNFWTGATEYKLVPLESSIDASPRAKPATRGPSGY